MRGFLKNKRGADGTEFFSWWDYFVILPIVLVGVIVILNSFTSGNIDVRPMEEKYLAQHVADCLSSEKTGFVFYNSLVDNFKFEEQEKFLSHCNLNFEPKNEDGSYEYFVNVSYYEYSGFDMNDPQNLIKTITLGNPNRGIEREIKKTLKPYYFYVATLNEEYVLEIKPAVGKNSEN